MTLILLALACCIPAIPTNPVVEAQISEVLAQLTAEDAAAKAEAFKAFPTVRVDEVDSEKYCAPKSAPKFVNSRTTVHAVVVTDMADKVSRVLVKWIHVANIADSWLFFDHATVAVGDFRSKVTFNNTLRDSDGREIWEYATLLLSEDASYFPGRAIDGKVAEKMADPGKVIIRLEGREHYDDYEMNAWEKASIKAGLVLAKRAPTRDDAAAVLAARPPEAAPGTLNTTEAQ